MTRITRLYGRFGRVLSFDPNRQTLNALAGRLFNVTSLRGWRPTRTPTDRKALIFSPTLLITLGQVPTPLSGLQCKVNHQHNPGFGPTGVTTGLRSVPKVPLSPVPESLHHPPGGTEPSGERRSLPLSSSPSLFHCAYLLTLPRPDRVGIRQGRRSHRPPTGQSLSPGT